MNIIEFFNLNYYEQNDLRALISTHKKWDGYTYQKVNRLDKIVNKEHNYISNRLSILGIWILLGMFIPLWILLMILGITYVISLIICIAIGIIGEVLYQNSCDKIDYNYLVGKNQQLNLFKDCGIDYIS